MSASTTLITDLTTCANATPSAQSLANAAAASGPIQDVKGNLTLALRKMQEAKVLLEEVDSVVDAGDTTIQTPLTNVLASLA